jgi:hypothetical protein
MNDLGFTYLAQFRWGRRLLFFLCFANQAAALDEVIVVQRISSWTLDPQAVTSRREMKGSGPTVSA